MRPPRPDWGCHNTAKKGEGVLRNAAHKEYILNLATDISQRTITWRIKRSDGNVKFYLRKANRPHGKTDGN